MPKKTATTSLRMTEADRKNVARVQELTGRDQPIADVLRDALAAYVTQLERRTKTGTGELAIEIREIAKDVVAEAFAKKAKELRRARRAPREPTLPDLMRLMHADKKVLKLVKSELDAGLNLLAEVLESKSAE